MQQTPLVLVCDDQPTVHEPLKAYLENEGLRYEAAFDGEEALEKIKKLQPDMVVLDIMMPKMSGIDVCREVRKTSRVPIIMLTARGEEIDRILGLELGADDYIVKPHSNREVVARIKAVLRRISESAESPVASVLRFGNLEINLGRYEVRVDGQVVPMTPKEVEVLHMLASQPSRVFDREQILSQVWGYDYFGDNRAVDTQIKRIRQKLPTENVSYSIKTIYGIGYKFEVDEA